MHCNYTGLLIHLVPLALQAWCTNLTEPMKVVACNQLWKRSDSTIWICGGIKASYDNL